MTSRRASWDLSGNRLWAALDARRAGGGELVDLVESNPTRVGLPYPASEIRDALSSPGVLAYEPSPRGLASAREAIARHSGFDPDRLILTASTSEAYGFLWKLLADPGDEILVPKPSYPLFDYLAGLDSVVPKDYALAYDGRWAIDMNSVERAVSPRTRAIVLVHPNNPTGSFARREEMDALARIAQSHDLALISDEVFSEYALSQDSSRAGAAALREDVLSFSLSGLSKLALLPQVKLGWVAVGGPKMDRVDALARLEVISDTYLSVSATAQHGAARLLEIMRPVRAALRSRIEENLRWLLQNRAEVLVPEGGWYAILRLPPNRSDVEWAVSLVEKEGLHVHPGSFYGLGPGFIVISLILPPNQFSTAGTRLVSRLRNS